MKTSVLLLFMFLYSFIGYAQLEGPSTLPQNHNALSGLHAPNAGFGIKGGVSFANARGSDKDIYGSVNSHTNFHGGVFTQFAFTEFFSLQAELLYSRKGFERSDSVFRFDYLDVPLLAVFNITQNLSLHLGPQVSFMVSAQFEDQEIDLEPYNTFDYGLAAGLEGRISRFRLGTRYNLGLADFRDQNAAGHDINQDIKNSVVQVYLGIGF